MIAIWLITGLFASGERTSGLKGTANSGDAGQTGGRAQLAAIGPTRVSGALGAEPGRPRLDRLFSAGSRLARRECTLLGVVAPTSQHRLGVDVLVLHCGNCLLRHLSHQRVPVFRRAHAPTGAGGCRARSEGRAYYAVCT